ncbi:ABC transporter ATP-binding protein [Aestuariivirga sp. YIM B02566]|uniref:ABC transporter ATP-binding protein n=1 Tax=Taklimakanibacter albus TaxID=2800327 RepID=UPI0032B21CB3
MIDSHLSAPDSREKPAFTFSHPAPDARSAHLAIAGVSKSYNGPAVVNDVALDLKRGEFVTLLGDSGCGKTTLLRIVAGFVHPDKGRVLVAGQDVTHTPPAQRHMGFVFQSYALFPTKTARQNIAFALTIAAKPRADIAARVSELARLFEIEALLERYPHELSGGQQQRVALARALAADPQVLLLDEPMSALDARIRIKLRSEIRALVDRLGITTLYVTHDQEEALALSDRVAIMRQGRIEQIGTPAEIYHRPATRFVAQFIGSSNLIKGRALSYGLETTDGVWPLADRMKTSDAGRPMTALYRPEHIEVLPGDTKGITGRIETMTFLGAHLRLGVALPSGQRIIADRPSLENPQGFAIGMPVSVRPDAGTAVIVRDDMP